MISNEVEMPQVDSIEDLMARIESQEEVSGKAGDTEATIRYDENFAQERQMKVNEPNSIHGRELMSSVYGNPIPERRYREFLNLTYQNTPFSDGLNDDRIIGPGMGLTMSVNAMSDQPIKHQEMKFEDTYHPGRTRRDSDLVRVPANGEILRTTKGRKQPEAIGVSNTIFADGDEEIIAAQQAAQELSVAREDRSNNFLQEVIFDHNPAYYDEKDFTSQDIEVRWEEKIADEGIVATGRLIDQDGEVPMEFEETYGKISWFMDNYVDHQDEYGRSPTYWMARNQIDMLNNVAKAPFRGLAAD